MSDDLVRDAEQIVLGSMLLDPSVIEPIAAQLRSHDFADSRHGSIFAAITAVNAANGETGAVAIALALQSVGELERVGGASYLHDLVTTVPVTFNAPWYAGVVADAAAARAARVDAYRLLHITETGDMERVAAEQARLVDQWTARPAAGTVRTATELDDFLNEDDGEGHDWRIPGLVERGDRLIITGGEGQGKSTLLRQIALQAAAGIHPFTLAEIEPLCVLIVDLENSTAQVRRELRPLRLAAGERYRSKPGLHIRVRPDGLDLLSEDDGRWLLDLAHAVQPDVLITGPLYKLASGDPTEERTARSVTAWLDRVRVETGTAMLLEGHTPHGTNGGRRPIRPYGASLWLRWPEFGIYLSPEGQLQHWRGPRDQRDWPAALKRGGEWPWTQVTNPAAVRWASIVDLCTQAEGQLTERDLAKLLGVGPSTIHRDIEAHRIEWDRLASSQVRGAGAE